ncbi:GntR family transcriptional regulator, partial [Streptococcus danieliae]|nr:GntR family transcriptional regulator [Streptococcus danieliae]
LILDGVLAPGLRLPATRALAQSLGVSRDTLEMAYAQLRLDGYIQRQAGSGSFVSPTIGASLLGKPAAALPPMSAQPVALSMRGAQILGSGGVADQQSVKAFATGLPETRAFPLAVWERLRRQAASEHLAGVLLH